MRAAPFDLGLSAEDERALRAARQGTFEFDREAALKLMADASPTVDAAVRRRPLFTGAPFTLHADDDASGGRAASLPGGSIPPRER